MTVDDVLEGLKHCSKCDIDTCYGCPYCGVFKCNDKLKEDAVDVIKELQVQVDALKKTLKAAIKNSGINFGMWKEAQAEVERLLAQLPVDDENISEFADFESGKCWDLFDEKEVQE